MMFDYKPCQKKWHFSNNSPRISEPEKGGGQSRTALSTLVSVREDVFNMPSGPLPVPAFTIKDQFTDVKYDHFLLMLKYQLITLTTKNMLQTFKASLHELKVFFVCVGSYGSKMSLCFHSLLSAPYSNGFPRGQLSSSIQPNNGR